MALKSHDPSQRANRFYDLSRRSNYHICKGNLRFNNTVDRDNRQVLYLPKTILRGGENIE